MSESIKGSLPPMRRRLRENRRLLVVLGCLAVFLVLLNKVMQGEIMRMDQIAHALIVQKLRTPWLTPVMETLSALATPVVLIVMLLVIAAFAPGRRPGWCCALNLCLAALLNVALKAIVQRPRPDESLRLVIEHGFSFPSGHSMAAMAFFGLIVWIIWRYGRNRRQRVLLCTAFSIVIVLIGVSRIYLGVHYASDVLGGFCASLVWLAFYTRVMAPSFLDAPDAGDA